MIFPRLQLEILRLKLIIPRSILIIPRFLTTRFVSMMGEILEYINMKKIKGCLYARFRENVGITFIMEVCV